MKEPADGNGGRRTSNSFGHNIALRIQSELEYVQEAIARPTTPEEDVGLAHALWGLAHARAYAVSKNDRDTLDRLESALDAGRLNISTYARSKAKPLLNDARAGDLDALRRMLTWAAREDI